MNTILKNRTLVILGTAESISSFGDWVTMLAVLAMLVFRGDGGVAQSSGVFLAGLLPSLVSSPFAGWLVDRINRKTLLIASQLFSGMVVSILFFTYRMEIIYTVLALEAVILSVFAPARQSIIPDIVSREEFPRVNAFLQQLAGLVKVFSPVLAGLILSVMAPHIAILFDVASFFIAGGILFLLPPLLPQTKIEVVPEKKSSDLSSIAFIKKTPQLQILFLVVFVAIFAIIGFDVLSSVYIRDVLKQGEKLFGLAVGLVGIGSLIATVLLLGRKKPVNPWKDILAGYALLAAIPLSLVTSAVTGTSQISTNVVLGGCLIGGIGNGFVLVQTGTLLQYLSPKGILGQMSGYLQTVMVAGQLLGLIITPILVPAKIGMNVYFTGTLVIMLVLLLFLTIKIFYKNTLNPENGYEQFTG